MGQYSLDFLAERGEERIETTTATSKEERFCNFCQREERGEGVRERREEQEIAVDGVPSLDLRFLSLLGGRVSERERSGFEEGLSNWKRSDVLI